MKFSTLKFTDLIEAEKKRKRITNNQVLADNIDVSKQTIENIMRGVTKPSIDILCKIAIALKVDLPVFFDYGKTEPVDASPITVYEPETDLTKCYKIMFEQQKEIADQQKEITELKVEIERIKNANAVGGTAKAG